MLIKEEPVVVRDTTVVRDDTDSNTAVVLIVALLVVAAALLIIGTIGVLTRRNAVNVLMGVELILCGLLGRVGRLVRHNHYKWCSLVNLKG